MSIFDIAGCEEKIGYSFNDKMLLRKCFTHASYANEHNESDNELLEFFGDSIIQFVVTEHLYKNGYGDEGDLTQIRAQLVAKTPLLKAVKMLGVEEFVLLGRGQGKSARQDEKLFSSIYEALVAGIYIDGGMVAAKKFIMRTLVSALEKKTEKVEKQTDGRDHKSRFQEYVQNIHIHHLSSEYYVHHLLFLSAKQYAYD